MEDRATPDPRPVAVLAVWLEEREIDDEDGQEVEAYSPVMAVPRPSPEQVDLGRELRRARLEARLTREELGERTRHPPGEIAGVEAGYIRVGERYVVEVLEACGVPEDRIGDHPGIAPAV